MPDVTFTVDGKKLTAPAGTLLIDACKSAGIEIPAFCYYPGLSLQAACRMCVVRIEKMPKLQTACTTPVAEGMVVAHRDARDRPGPQGHAATAARQPSARLPRLRCRRRVRAAGHDLQVRRGRQLLRRAQEPPRRAEVVAGRLLRPPALHPLLSLRAHVRRRHGRLRARHPEPRQLLGHRAQHSRAYVARRPRACRLRAVRHVHRRLPRRRADQRNLSLQDAPVGDEPRRHHLHPLRRWLQDHARRSLAPPTAPRSCAATTATRAASTATSSATRAATPSTSPTTTTASPSRSSASPTAN